MVLLRTIARGCSLVEDETAVKRVSECHKYGAIDGNERNISVCENAESIEVANHGR